MFKSEAISMINNDTDRQQDTKQAEADFSRVGVTLPPPPNTYRLGIYKDDNEDAPYIWHIFGSKFRFGKEFAPAFEPN